MSVIRVGSSNKYAEGWDSIFGGGRGAKKAAGPKAATKKKASRAVKKKAVTQARKPGKSRRG